MKIWKRNKLTRIKPHQRINQAKNSWIFWDENDNGLKIKITLQRVMDLQSVKILRVSNLYAISKIIYINGLY